MRWISFSLVQSQRGKLGSDCPTTDTPNCAGSVPTPSETRVWKCFLGVEPGWLALRPRVPTSPGPAPGLQSEVEVLLWLAGEQGWWRAGAPGSGLLCGDKLHNHADNSRTSRTRTQVRAWVFNFILEELVKFTAKFLYQFSYLQWKCSVSCAGRKGEGFHREISNHEYHSAAY